MSTLDNKPGAVLPNLMQLEQRLMFDGAAVEASIDSLADHAGDHQVVAAADDMFSLAVAHGQTQQATEQAQQQIKDYLENASAEELFQLFNGGKDTLDAQWLQSMEALRQSILSGEYQVRVEFLDNETIKGALGAFAAEGTDDEPTIYLNRDWVEGVAGEQDVVKVLVEELGHSIDSLVNAGADTAGDEGEGFAGQVMGLSTDGAPHWVTDDDHFTIELDGESHEVEAATLNFVNAYEMVYDLDNDGIIDNNERWADKEQNSHYFNTAGLGTVTVDDDTNSRYFSGNDVSAIGINIGGNTYYGWISRPIKAGGEVRGFYFWTDTNFTDLATAQSDGNTDGDRDIADNRGFLLVVDQAWFDQQIAAGSSLTINNAKDGNLGAITVANIGSSSDRVDNALNSFVVPNSDPDAANDSLTVAEDSGTTDVLADSGLLSNDTDADLDGLTITSFTVDGVTTNAGDTYTISGVGDLRINADGSYAFTPVADYNGPVPPITYTVSDGNGGTATAVLSIQVTPVNDVPVGSDDHIITSENTSKVLGIDDFGTYSDPENDPLSTIQITQLASDGELQYWDGSSWAAVTLNQEITVAQILQGKIRFTPDANESGVNYATIQFKVSDGQDYSVDAYTLSVEVTAGNQVPIANADTNEVSEEGCEVAAADTTGNVLTDGSPDSDPENQPLTVSAVTFNGNTLVVSGPTVIQGQYGTLTIYADGNYSYALDNSLADIDAMNTDAQKFDVFSYTVTDGTDSSTATLNLTINGTNDAPVAADDAGTFIEGENAGTGNFGTVSGDALVNDSDVDDDNSSLEVVLNGTTPSGGADVVLDASSPISSVTLTVTDSGGDGWTATVPTSGQTPVWTDAGLSVPALDAAGNPLTVYRSGSGANATLVFSDNVALYDYQNINLYIADANKTAIVQVTITSATTTASTTIYSNDDVSGVQAGYLVSGTDKNGQPLTGVTVVSVDPASKTITLDTAVEVDNASLTFQDPNAITLADTETYFAGTYGYLIINEDGSYTYTLTTDLAAEQVVTEQFTYTVKDVAGCTDTAVITIRATGVDAPKLANDTLVVSEDTGTHVTFNGNAGNDLTDALVTNDADGTIITLGNVKEFQVAGDPALYSAGATAIISGVGELTITADGKVTFDPVDDYLGPVPTVTYTRTGSDLQDYDAQLTITIQSVDDASDLLPDSNSVPEETTATGNVLANDSDVDSVLTVGSFSFTSNGSTVSYPAGDTAQEVRDGSNNLIGTIVLESNGSYSFVPVANWNGSVPQITYTTNTGSTSTLDITVTPVNDAPVLDLDADDSSVPGSDFSSSYTIGTTGVSIADTDALITDVDDTHIESAVIVLENAQLGDDLTVVQGVLLAGISASGPAIIDGKITITLSGSATLADYQAAVQAITFSSDSQFTMDRVISVRVNDGDIDSNIAYTTLTIAPDARELTVNGTTVNEASPYVQFQVGGVAGQWVSLTLSETSNGNDATMGTDFLPNLQYFDGSDWVDYSGGMIQIPTGDGTLLVRTPVLQDAINEGAETLKLTATNQAGTDATGISTIIDDGTGSVFLGNNDTPTPNGEGDTDPDGPDYPEYLDDDRPVTVDSIVVNEASPWAMFTVTGHDGQKLALALHDGTATKGDGNPADGSEDYGTGIEYWDGSTWAVYNGVSVTMSGETLLVRTAIHQDSLFEGQHSFSLGVTKLSSGDSVYGIADIYDDGTGKTYTFDDPNDGTPEIAEGPGAGFDDDRTLTIDSPVVNEDSNYTVFTLTGNSGQTVELELIDESDDGSGGAVDGKANIDENQILKVWDGLDWVDYNPDHLPTFDGNGKIYVRVDITPEQDDVFEDSETFKLNASLSGQSDIVTGTATIRDNGTGVIYPEIPTDPEIPGGSTPGTDDDRPTNTAPASTDDSITTQEDVPHVLGLDDFGAFSDPENDDLDQVQITQLPLKGALQYNDAADGQPENWVSVNVDEIFTAADIAGGKLRFVPDANESGDNYTTLQFKVSDGALYSADTYTLTIHVTPVNDSTLVGGDTSGSEDEDTSITGTLTATDADGLTDGSYFTVTGTPANGTAVIDPATGEWTYTPKGDHHGNDSFTVTITDDDGNTTTQMIAVTVNPVVDIADDTATTDEDTPVTTTVLANDSFEGTPVVTGVTQGANGTVVNNGDGTVTYTPDANFHGTDTYTYTVTSGGVTETATVTVTVNSVDDPAVIGGHTSGSADEDTSITGTLTATDADGLTDGSYFTVTGHPSNGSASIDPETGEWSYTPNADYNGNDSFTVTVTDDEGHTRTQVINLTVNPVADIVNDTDSTDEDMPVTTNVLANDSFEGTPVVTGVTQGANGTVVNNGDGTVTYTPDANFHGTDTYTYTVTSGGVTETATVTVTVNSVADPAVIGGNTSGSADEDTSITGTLTATDADGLTDGSYFTVTGHPSNGSASIDPETGKWSYTPNPDYNGNDSFSVTVTDDEGYTMTQVISLTVNPVADIVNDTDSTDEDTPVTTNVLANDSFEGSPVVTGVTQGANGTVVNNGDGTVTYTPDANFHGTDTYTYTVMSGGVTETATVTVTVTPVNDTPVLVDGNGDPLGEDQSVTTPEDTPVSGQLEAEDVDGDELTFSKTTDPANGTVTVNSDGGWEYTPNPGYSGNDSFTVTVSDGKGGTDTLTVNVEVTPKPVVVPPAPVAPAPSTDIPPPPPPPAEVAEAPKEEPVVELDQPVQTGQILVQRDIPEQTFASSNGITLISFSIPTDTFGHTEPGAEITLSAVLSDGRPIPDWLLFDPEKGEFRGVAPKGFDGTLIIRVIARDQNGHQVETMVTIQVRSEQVDTAEVIHEGKGGLMQQLQTHNQFAWKAERDRLIGLARAAAEERSGNA